MARNTRGRKAPPTQSRRQPYVWKSPTFHRIGDILLIASVVALVAAIILYMSNQPNLALTIFSLCFVLYGMPEFLKAYENHSLKGDKAVTVGCLALGILFTVAGILFFVFLALNPNLK